MTIENTRLLVAEEAARLLFEEGYRDYLVAKQKATQNLGVSTDKSNQPSNMDVYHAILSRRELLGTEEDEQQLQAIRQVALEAMEFLQRFKPVLVGGALDGSAGKYSPAVLHLFPSTPEEVIFFLEDNNIPFQTHERKTRIHGRQMMIPFLRFFVDDFEVELVLFEEGSRFAPQSVITGRAMERCGLEGVRALLKQNARA
ncbi:MAG: Unknown protein [uncultured Thiotrichaceae bacterium]|uniref:Nucleotidyltransferase n=1 Tax=uncultured Thiotrichaceae bacterium TaxID=298394 RepID=A0A6S6U8P8_9GAMM|nr:MAG: Unknown protein [uncultured Thiotrichaceae bacterium]